MIVEVPAWIVIAAKAAGIVAAASAAIGILILAYCGAVFLYGIGKGPFWR